MDTSQSQSIIQIPNKLNNNNQVNQQQNQKIVIQ